jgi:hypothetical protein
MPSVFDPAPGPAPSFDGQGAAGFTAAGMLSPLAELETADAGRWPPAAGTASRTGCVTGGRNAAACTPHFPAGAA